MLKVTWVASFFFHIELAGSGIFKEKGRIWAPISPGSVHIQVSHCRKLELPVDPSSSSWRDGWCHALQLVRGSAKLRLGYWWVQRIPRGNQIGQCPKCIPVWNRQDGHRRQNGGAPEKKKVPGGLWAQSGLDWIELTAPPSSWKKAIRGNPSIYGLTSEKRKYSLRERDTGKRKKSN